MIVGSEARGSCGGLERSARELSGIGCAMEASGGGCIADPLAAASAKLIHFHGLAINLMPVMPNAGIAPSSAPLFGVDCPARMGNVVVVVVVVALCVELERQCERAQRQRKAAIPN